jgi:adenine nucleotide transporter 17
MLIAALLLDSLKHAVAASASGSVAMAMLYPIDLVRTHQQASTQRLSIAATVRRLWRADTSLYAGLAPVLLSLTVSNLLFFFTYSLLLRLCALRRAGAVSPSLNSALALLSGVANVLLTSPLWVAATQLKFQSRSARSDDNDAAAKRRRATFDGGLLRCIAEIAQTQGVAALWRGTAASLLLVCAPTVQMTIYDQVKSRLIARGAAPSSRMFFALGGVSKLFSTLSTYPLQLLQTRVRQSQRTMLQALHQLLREEGALALYKGIETKLLQTLLQSALHFMMYEWARALLGAKQRLLTAKS